MSKFYELRLGEGTKHRINGGMKLGDESSLDFSQSPYNGLLNMLLDESGSLGKRKGQAYVYPTTLGAGAINGLYYYKGKVIIAHTTKLYTQTGANQPTQIYSGVANAPVNFFVYNNLLYMLDGTNYLQYDGTTVKAVTAYIPRVTMNRKPDGSSSAVDESWNMLGSGFKDSFNGDGTSKVYTLSLKGLDATTVTCNTGGTEGSGFTVDRVNGTVTFTTAPAAGTNNVEITAYKTVAGLANNILKCTVATEFSNRMFFSGNASLPNYYFAAGLSSNMDASYFPQKYQYQLGTVDKKVTGFKVHFNKLIVFKEDLTALVEAATGLDNTASFPVSFLNTEVGCDIPNSIQLINNNVVFANTYAGVFVIASTMVAGEKSVLPISLNVNGTYEYPGLLGEPINLLKSAMCIDHNYKYYLSLGNRCYVYDYRSGINTANPWENKWFLIDNIKSSCFIIVDNELYYGSNTTGMLVKFVPAYSDFGNPIKAIWRSKLIDFGYPDFLKFIREIFVTFRNNSTTNSTIDVKYFNEREVIAEQILIPGNNQFAWNTLGWTNFSWEVNLFNKTLRDSTRIKKISYFQVEFSNNTLNENLAIKNIVIRYRMLRQVK